MINLSLPLFQRYLIWTAVEGKHLFKPTLLGDIAEDFVTTLPMKLEDIQIDETKLR